MFCTHCGAQIPEGSRFCTSCGTPVEGSAPKNPASSQANAYSPYANAQPQQGYGRQGGSRWAGSQKRAASSPILTNLIQTVKSFFTSADQVDLIARSAEDTSWSGVILLAAGIVLFGLSMLVFFARLANRILVMTASLLDFSTYGLGTAKIMPYGSIFLYSMLLALVVDAVLVGLLWLVARFLCGKDLSISGAVNLVAYASLPMLCVSLLNMLLVLIWWPLTIVFLFLALMANIVLLYHATLKAMNLGRIFWLLFALVLVVTMLFFALFTYLGVRGSGTALVHKVSKALDSSWWDW